MTFEQFKYLLDAYGANLRRWPSQARLAAEALIATDPAAAAARREAQHLDRALDLYGVAIDEVAARRLARRIAAEASAHDRAAVGQAHSDQARSGQAHSGLRAFWPRAAALAFVMLLGIVTGMFQTDFTGTSDRISAASGASLVSVDENSFDVAGL